MDRNLRARIAGTGSFVPPRRLTNADLEKMVDTSDEWITTRTGIKERRIADDKISCADMAIGAARQAMDAANCAPEEIEMVINGTVTPDYRLPSNACVVQENLGLVNAAAFDVVAACTGFINGLSVASMYIETGRIKKALVIGSEKLSSICNYEDRNTCVLFGDAAGAVVLEPSTNGSGVLSTFLKSDGRMREFLWIPNGGSLNPIDSDFTFDGSDKIAMNGSEVFRIAVREMAKASQTVLDQAGIGADDISLVIPHQANVRIIDALAKRLKLDVDKVYVNIDRFGNTSSASVPLALDEVNRSGRIKPGDNVLMVAFGAGLIWGAAVVKW